MRQSLLPAVLLAAVLTSPTAADEGATCQTSWRLLALEAGPEDRYRHDVLLTEAARVIARELPGLVVRTTAGPALEAERTPLFTLEECRAYGRKVLAQAEAAGVDLKTPDIVFIFGPAFACAFGYSHQTYRMKDGTRVYWAFVTTRPLLVLKRQARNGPPELRELARTLEPALTGAFQRTGLERTMVLGVAVHEFGHFLAPGDTSLRDGYQTRWIGHEGHQPRCCMRTGLPAVEPRALLEKAVFGGRRLITFCDLCRQRLGVPHPPKSKWQQRFDRWLPRD